MKKKNPKQIVANFIEIGSFSGNPLLSIKLNKKRSYNNKSYIVNKFNKITLIINDLNDNLINKNK